MKVAENNGCLKRNEQDVFTRNTINNLETTKSVANKLNRTTLLVALYFVKMRICRTKMCFSLRHKYSKNKCHNNNTDFSVHNARKRPKITPTNIEYDVKVLLHAKWCNNLKYSFYNPIVFLACWHHKSYTWVYVMSEKYTHSHKQGIQSCYYYYYTQ